MPAELPEDLPGVPDLDCVWCGSVVYDRDAEYIHGRRFCRVPCAAQYRAEMAETTGDKPS